MNIRLRTWALAIAACAAILLPAAAAHAVGIYDSKGNLVYSGDLSMEDCNELTEGTDYVCFGLATGGGGGTPVLERLNGGAVLVMRGNRATVAVATAADGRALKALAKQPRGTRAASLRKAFQKAYAAGDRKVSDAVATALSRQFNARITGADKR